MIGVLGKRHGITMARPFADRNAAKAPQGRHLSLLYTANYAAILLFHTILLGPRRQHGGKIDPAIEHRSTL